MRNIALLEATMRHILDNPELHTQTWRPIPRYQGAYEASDAGNVRSVDRTVNYSDGRTGKYPGQQLSLQPKRHGYQTVKLSWRGRQRTELVHCLVLEAFVGPRVADLVARHLNGLPADNRLENLAWGTVRENSQDMVAHGRCASSQRLVCAQGHPYDEANTYWVPGRNRRMCRQCRRKWGRTSSARAARRSAVKDLVNGDELRARGDYGEYEAQS